MEKPPTASLFVGTLFLHLPKVLKTYAKHIFSQEPFTLKPTCQIQHLGSRQTNPNTEQATRAFNLYFQTLKNRFNAMFIII